MVTVCLCARAFRSLFDLDRMVARSKTAASRCVLKLVSACNTYVTNSSLCNRPHINSAGNQKPHSKNDFRQSYVLRIVGFSTWKPFCRLCSHRPGQSSSVHSGRIQTGFGYGRGPSRFVLMVQPCLSKFKAFIETQKMLIATARFRP